MYSGLNNKKQDSEQVDNNNFKDCFLNERVNQSMVLKNLVNPEIAVPREMRNNEINKKRLDYLSWSDTFMGLAKLVAMRSKDPKTQVGACVINAENRIVSVGYNGMPNGCSDDLFPWGKGSDTGTDKHLYVCHAETNAIHNRNTSSLKGCTMYVTLFPCNECAKHIIQSGIVEVVYLLDKDPLKKKTVAAKIMFEYAGVIFRKFEPSTNGRKGRIHIDLSDGN